MMHPSLPQNRPPKFLPPLLLPNARVAVRPSIKIPGCECILFLRLFSSLSSYSPCRSAHFLSIADSLISLKKISPQQNFDSDDDDDDDVPIPTQEDDTGSGPEGVEGWAEYAVEMLSQVDEGRRKNRQNWAGYCYEHGAAQVY